MSHVERFLDVPGGRLRLVIDGPAATDGAEAAPPVLLVHSAVVNLRSWDAMVPLLVDAGYRVIRYDVRGFGESTTEDIAFSNTDDLRAVLDAADARRVAVAGNSRGAIIALDAILETPDRFVAYAWIGGGISGFRSDLTPPPEEEALDREWEAAQAARDIDAMTDLDVRAWMDGIGQPSTRVPGEIRDWMRAMTRPLNDPDRVFGQPTSLDPPAASRLGELRVPTLVVIGELDTGGTRAAAAHLAANAPNARLVSWPDVAHMIGMEQPERLAATLVEFLAPLPRWR